MKNNTLYLVRFIAISIVASLCLFIPISTAEAKFTGMSWPSYTGNLSEIDGELTVFNHTFEYEAVGSRPDMGWYHYDPTIISATAIDVGGDHSIVMQTDITGKGASPTIGTFAIGHSMMGQYSVSWDYRVTCTDNLTASDKAALYFRDNGGHIASDRWSDVILMGNQIGHNGTNKLISFDQWHHIEAMVDTASASMSVYVDGELISDSAIPTDRPPRRIYSSKRGLAANDRKLSYMIDNIEVRCPTTYDPDICW